MATYIDQADTTLADLKTWLLKQLGYPLITVELTDEQLKTAIDDSIEFYTEYAEMGDNYVMMNLSGYVENTGLSLSGFNAKSVFTLDEELDGSINTLFSIENQMANQGVLPYHHGMGKSYVSFELASQFVDMSRRYLGQRFDFNYNPQSQVLKLFPDPKQQNKEGFIVLGLKTIPPLSELYGNWYVKRLALAKAKIILGLVRSKFGNVQLPGGGNVDTTVGDQGQSEWEKWTDEIVKWTGPHSSFYIG
jgi:hypothetical protein